MTSGVRKNPVTITCQQCGKTALWKGGRKRIYCSPNCVTKAKRKPSTRKRKRLGPQKQLSDQLKIERGHCADCHMPINTRTVVAIDWDHRDPATKTFTIAYQMNRVTDDQLRAEIAKCDAVCRNCHAYRTHDGKHYLNGQTNQPDEIPLFNE